MNTLTERTEFYREYVGTPKGRDKIAITFRDRVWNQLPYLSHALRMCQVVEQIDEPVPYLSHDLQVDSHPLVPISRIRRSTEPIEWLFDKMRHELHSGLDAWAIELLHNSAFDLGESDHNTEYAAMTETHFGGLLDKALDQCSPKGLVFYNAGVRLSGPPLVLTKDRTLLRSGLVGEYRDYAFYKSRLVPVGTVYVTGGLGDIHINLAVISADVPPEIGWKATLKAQVKLRMPSGVSFRIIQD